MMGTVTDKSETATEEFGRLAVEAVAAVEEVLDQADAMVRDAAHSKRARARKERRRSRHSRQEAPKGTD